MADLGFDGKVAIITGAGGGLGRSHALELAKRGALHRRQRPRRLGRRHRRLGRPRPRRWSTRSRPPAARPSPTTTASPRPRAAQAIVKTALDAFGRVDILINNAGILRDTSFKNMTPDQLNPVLDVHLRGAFYVTQPGVADHARPELRPHRQHLVGAGVFGNFGQTNYGAAKMGLVGFTRVLAVEGAKNNIKANAIAPVARTRMTEELLGPVADKLGPEFVTPVVTYLAHEDCEVTGEVYSVGGGRVARVFIGVTPGYRRARPHRRGRARQLRQDPRRGRLRGPRQPQRRDGARPQGPGLRAFWGQLSGTIRDSCPQFAGDSAGVVDEVAVAVAEHLESGRLEAAVTLLVDLFVEWSVVPAGVDLCHDPRVAPAGSRRCR